MHLKQYGKQVHIPLLISASVAVIGGFALLNQGLYETVGHSWYQVADENREPIYADFLANSLTRVMNLVDVLNLAKSHHILGGEFVYQTGWPAKPCWLVSSSSSRWSCCTRFLLHCDKAS